MIKNIIDSVIAHVQPVFAFVQRSINATVNILSNEFHRGQYGGFVIDLITIAVCCYLFVRLIKSIPSVLATLMELILDPILKVYYTVRNLLTIYGNNNLFLPRIEVNNVGLILEPRTDIYIRDQTTALKVLHRLMFYNIRFKKLVLVREVSMTLLLDENDKLLAAVIDSAGTPGFVSSNCKEVVYSYNASFDNKCKKVVCAHTHTPSVSLCCHGYTDSANIYPSIEDVMSYISTKKELAPVEIKYELILSGYKSRSYFELNPEGFEKKLEMGYISREISDMGRIRRYKWKIRPCNFPRSCFREIYNATRRDEKLHPTLVGIKLKYSSKVPKIINQKEGLEEWVLTQKTKSRKS